MLPDTQPAIVLVKPQMGENIGAAARAMANFGFSDLRIVDPRDGWPNDKALSLAAGAFDHIPEPRLYESLKDSIHDCNFVLATTVRNRDMVKPILEPVQAAADAHTYMQSGAKVAFVFGGERSGLDNDDIALCSGIINIPTDPSFSSLNLGQAVLLILSTLRFYDAPCPEQPPRAKDSPPVSGKDLSGFLDRLEEELERADFFKAKGLKPTMVRNIQNIFTRNDLSEQEVRTLQGVLSALVKGANP